MKFTKIVTLFIFFGLFSSGLQAQGKVFPDANLKTLTGKTVSIKEYAKPGQITVVSFWATWCAPCKRELDAILDLYPEWKVKHGVEVVAVSIDSQRQLAKVGPMVKAKRWPYTVLLDTERNLKNKLNFQAIPQTFLVDKDGKIIYEHSGYVSGAEYELEEEIIKAAK